MSIQVPPLNYRLDTGQTTPLSAQQHDENLDILKNSIEALSNLMGVTLGEDGTLKDGAIYDPAQLADRVVTKDKLHWHANFFALATSSDGLAYEVDIQPYGTGTDDPCAEGINLALTEYGNGSTTAFAAPLLFKATNTGTAVTLDVNGVGPASVKKFGDQDLEVGDIVDSTIYVVVFDGVNFQIVSQIASNKKVETSGDEGWVDCPAALGSLSVSHNYERPPDVVKVWLRPKVADQPQNGYDENDIVDGLTSLFMWISTPSEPNVPPDWQHSAISVRHTATATTAMFQKDYGTSDTKYIVAKDGGLGHPLGDVNSAFDNTKWQAKMEAIWI